MSRENTVLTEQGKFPSVRFISFIVGVLAIVAIATLLDTNTLQQRVYRTSNSVAGDVDGAKQDEQLTVIEVATPQPTQTIEGTPAIVQAIAVQATPTPKATAKPTVTPKPTVKPTRTPTPTPTRTVAPTPTPVPTIDYSHPWTVAPNCPATTLSCIPCTSGIYCRFEPGKTHGFQGWSCQNNNPGNIRNASTNMATDWKNLMIKNNGGTAACGVRNDKRGGSYFVFSSYSAGEGALKAYIKGVNKGEHSAYTGCGNCTLSFFFSKYSPGDGTYASTVAAEIGEPVTQTLQYVVDNKLNAFVAAIKRHEGFFTQ